MQNANEKDNAALVERLEHMQGLLAEAIALAAGGKARGQRPTKLKARTAPKKAVIGDMDYSTNLRAFVRKYGSQMNGQKKFVLLVAHLTKGDASKRISLEEVERHWNRMTAKGLLGMKFNRFYTTKAKEHDWVNTEKHGLYHLRPSWKDIFHE
ncbi:MAG: hypothetical protein ACRD3O_00300 [Terriglobia bacterium]